MKVRIILQVLKKNILKFYSSKLQTDCFQKYIKLHEGTHKINMVFYFSLRNKYMTLLFYIFANDTHFTI